MELCSCRSTILLLPVLSSRFPASSRLHHSSMWTWKRTPAADPSALRRQLPSPGQPSWVHVDGVQVRIQSGTVGNAQRGAMDELGSCRFVCITSAELDAVFIYRWELFRSASNNFVTLRKILIQMSTCKFVEEKLSAAISYEFPQSINYMTHNLIRGNSYSKENTGCVSVDTFKRLEMLRWRRLKGASRCVKSIACLYMYTQR